MNAVVLLQKRLEQHPYENNELILQCIATEKRRQERNKERFMRYLSSKGFPEWCPETKFKAEVLARVRGE